MGRYGFTISPITLSFTPENVLTGFPDGQTHSQIVSLRAAAKLTPVWEGGTVNESQCVKEDLACETQFKEDLAWKLNLKRTCPVKLNLKRTCPVTLN